jgi:hypothetical protein
MQTHAEAIGPTVTAQKTALAAAGAFTSLLNGGAAAIFEGEATVTTATGEPAPSYVVLANPAGEDESVFMKVGGRVRNTIDLWADTQAKVTDLYTQLAIVLDRKPLALGSGLPSVFGWTRLLATPRDPGRRRLYHGVVQYEGMAR